MAGPDLARRVAQLEATVARLASMLEAVPRSADDLLTIKEAAHAFGVHEQTARRWARGPAGEKIGGRLHVRRSVIEGGAMVAGSRPATMD